MLPIDALRTGVASYEPYLQASGEMLDPVFAEPTQYGTPFHALCQAVLAAVGLPAERDQRMARAIAGLDASLTYVSDPHRASPASGVARTTGALSAINHRDFFWPPILRTYLILRDLGAPAADEFARRIAAVDVPTVFRMRPPSNWAAVWVAGEWRRIRAGLSPTTVEQFDRWLEPYFANSILIEQGLYQEPGHPNSYDLFTRFQLADILTAGYDGAWRAQLERLMVTGLDRSLSVQLSDGSLASAFRSTGLTWTVGAQCAYLWLAAGYFRERDPRRSLLAIDAARRAFASFVRWQRPLGPYSPAENLLPPSYRVGYESYTADAHHGNLPLAFLALAVLDGFDQPPIPDHAGRAPATFVEDDPTYRALVHCGPYSAHVNAFPSSQYDGFGLVDLTFGPNRVLHLASSVRHLSEPGFYNLGLAIRERAGRSALRVIAQQDLRLIGRIERGPTEASLHLRARAKGDPYTYEMSLCADASGVHVEERTPNLVGYKTLLIPYLRDCGSGQVTEVGSEACGDTAVLRLRMGREAIQVRVEGALDHMVDLPFGYENRRGLCGLARVDMAHPSDRIRYHVAIET
ncbi:MAG: hypothetical protein JXA09_12630 [Anaerolineae bacterium]|nr:hypothetical protein [Anaerolineae bacterium]